MNKYAYTAAYILFNALSVLFIYGVGSRIPVDLMITLSSFYALIFFHVVQFKNVSALYQKVWHSKALYLKTIIVFLVMWSLCFLIPVYFTPALLMFFATAWPACIGAFFQFRQRKMRRSLYFSLGIGAVILSFYLAL